MELITIIMTGQFVCKIITICYSLAKLEMEQSSKKGKDVWMRKKNLHVDYYKCKKDPGWNLTLEQGKHAKIFDKISELIKTYKITQELFDKYNIKGFEAIDQTDFTEKSSINISDQRKKGLVVEQLVELTDMMKPLIRNFGLKFIALAEGEILDVELCETLFEGGSGMFGNTTKRSKGVPKILAISAQAKMLRKLHLEGDAMRELHRQLGEDLSKDSKVPLKIRVHKSTVFSSCIEARL